MVQAARRTKGKGNIALQRYNAFRKSTQPKLKTEHPAFHHKDLQQEMSRMWKGKSEEEKKVRNYKLFLYYIILYNDKVGL